MTRTVPSLEQSGELKGEALTWHVARAISVPEHHTTWDTLTEREKDLYFMQAGYAISALQSTQPDALESAQAEIARLTAALEAISTFQANGSGANYYFEETWRLVDIARAALNPKGR